MDYSKLIITAADFKIVLSITGGGKYPLLTAESASFNSSSSAELVYAIGEEDPVGIKANERKRSGKFSMQVGELSAMLQIEGLPDATYIRNATLAVAALTGGFTRTYSGLYITSEAFDLKAKDKQSIVSMDWEALSMK